MRLLSYDELRPQKGIPYSKIHLWRLEREGKFPRRVRLGESRHGWLETEIDDWVLKRMAARNEECVVFTRAVKLAAHKDVAFEKEAEGQPSDRKLR